MIANRNVRVNPNSGPSRVPLSFSEIKGASEMWPAGAASVDCVNSLNCSARKSASSKFSDPVEGKVSKKVMLLLLRTR